MAKKAKMKCRVMCPGYKKVMFQLSADVPDWGKIKFDLQYSLENEEVSKAVMAIGVDTEVKLDGLEVDADNPESIQTYMGICMEALSGILETAK